MIHQHQGCSPPCGTFAIPAIATTATLHFTHVIHDGDSLMALGLTALTVGYDTVIGICRTWHKIPSSATTHRDGMPLTATTSLTRKTAPAASSRPNLIDRAPSDFEVGDDDHSAKRRHPVQETYALDFIGVLTQPRAGGVAGDRLADLGVDGDDDQGAV